MKETTDQGRPSQGDAAGSAAAFAVPEQLRTFLVLGRVANLPTVWSNCLAGWLLCWGDPEWLRFFWVCMGASCLYLGGMFLNDAFDAKWDARHRPERPIPSGRVTASSVWAMGFGFLVLGLLQLGMLGWPALIYGFLTSSAIIGYNACHKSTAWSAMLMGLCRMLLYPLAASQTSGGMSGIAAWGAVVLWCYVTGLTLMARHESFEASPVHAAAGGSKPAAATRGSEAYLLTILLLLPVGLAFLVNNDVFIWRAVFYGSLFVFWLIYSLARVAPGGGPLLRHAIPALLAGMVWVDLLAVAPDPLWALVFALLFVAARVLQKVAPAT